MDTQRSQDPEYYGKRKIIRGEVGHKGDRGTRQENPQEAIETWKNVEGGNGGRMMRDRPVDAGMRRGAQSERQRLEGLGVGDVQVDSFPDQERRWGAGVN